MISEKGIMLIQTVTIANGAALSDAFKFGSAEYGSVLVPASWTGANIGFKGSTTEDGTYIIIEHHDSGEPVQINNIDTTNSRWKEFPPEIKAFPWLKLWSKSSTDATETDQNQSGAKTLTVVTKS